MIKNTKNLKLKVTVEIQSMENQHVTNLNGGMAQCGLMLVYSVMSADQVLSFKKLQVIHTRIILDVSIKFCVLGRTRRASGIVSAIGRVGVKQRVHDYV